MTTTQTPESTIYRLKLPAAFVDALDAYVDAEYIKTNRTSFFKVLIGNFIQDNNIELFSYEVDQIQDLYHKLKQHQETEPTSISMRLHTPLEVDDRVLKNIASNIVLLGLYSDFEPYFY